MKHNAKRRDEPRFDVPGLRRRLAATRAASIDLIAPLTPEDMVVQAEPDASPTKWHLAHVTWFFEQFILRPYAADYTLFDARFNFCFNSYYEAHGARHPRAARGLLSRPSLEEVLAYRHHVDAALDRFLTGSPALDVLTLIELGINHEQQHQELILTDILALFAAQPLRPAYRARSMPPSATPAPSDDPSEARWVSFEGGLYQAGHGGSGFAWDNEGPGHQVLLRPFAISDRLVTNADWLEFIGDDGYGTPSLWLSDGWSTVAREAWTAPRYWDVIDGHWHETTLEGCGPLDPSACVRHISYYEADAYARWAGHRLPTEFEWETAALSGAGHLNDLFGAAWQWTASAYLPYPGCRPPLGAVGEYNGKFMVGQHVLRGSSFATPHGHSRPSYRNFFYPHQRWQFTGLRLAREIL